MIRMHAFQLLLSSFDVVYRSFCISIPLVLIVSDKFLFLDLLPFLKYSFPTGSVVSSLDSRCHQEIELKRFLWREHKEVDRRILHKTKDNGLSYTSCICSVGVRIHQVCTIAFKVSEYV